MERQPHRDIGRDQRELHHLGVAELGGDLVVKFTYAGDANLDGKINVDDYGHIDSSAPLGIAGWFNGDFNYDGKINVDDYGIIDFNVGIEGPPLSSATAVLSAADVSALPADAMSPLLSQPTSMLAVPANRDVFDSIFSTAYIL